MCNRYVTALVLGFGFGLGTNVWAVDGVMQRHPSEHKAHDVYAAEASKMLSARKQEKLRQWRMAQDEQLRGFQLDTSSSVAGQDTNHNGIRDDIENWLDHHIEDDLTTHAARQLAKAVQQTLVVDLNDKETFKLAAREHTIVSSCAVDLYHDIKHAKNLIDHVQGYTVNTPARQLAFDQYHAALENSHFYIPTIKDCDIRGLLGPSAVTFAIPDNAVIDAPLTQ